MSTQTYAAQLLEELNKADNALYRAWKKSAIDSVEMHAINRAQAIVQELIRELESR